MDFATNITLGKSPFRLSKTYEEVLHLLQLPPDVLSAEEKGLVDKYKDTYEDLATHSDCPYPFLEWWWKHVDYELEYVSPHLIAHNTFAERIAEWAGHMYIKHFL